VGINPRWPRRCSMARDGVAGQYGNDGKQVAQNFITVDGYNGSVDGVLGHPSKALTPYYIYIFLRSNNNNRGCPIRFNINTVSH